MILALADEKKPIFIKTAFMKLLFTLLFLALVASCSNKKPGGTEDGNDENNGSDEETGWKAKDKKKAVTDCAAFLMEGQENASESKAKEMCSCVIDKIEGDVSYKDFMKIYKETSEEDVEGSDLKKEWRKIDKISQQCLKKFQDQDQGNENQGTDDDGSDDEEQ